MERGRVRKPQRGAQGRKRKGRSRGLEIKKRDGHWHIVGTVHTQGRTVRVRASTHFPAAAEFFEAAEEERYRIEREIRQGSSVAPAQVYVSVAAEKYLATRVKRPFGATTVLYVKEIVRQFGLRHVREIPDAEWGAWIDSRMQGRKPETRERFLNVIAAFLNWCAKKPRQWCDATRLERDNEARNPRRRQRRRVQDLSTELIAFILDHAAPHLKAQLWTEWSTGARVSSILHGCRLCDLILAEGREQITFYDTKNGETVTAHLHARAVAVLKEYVTWRGMLHDREAPLFVTQRREPYSERTAGVQNKTAFNAMKRRARKGLRRQNLQKARELIVRGERQAAKDLVAQTRDAHRLIGRITQHWFRHLLATKLRGDLRAAMDQGGWIDERSVLGYTMDVPEHRRRLIDRLDADNEQIGVRTGIAKAVGK